MKKFILAFAAAIVLTVAVKGEVGDSFIQDNLKFTVLTEDDSPSVDVAPIDKSLSGDIVIPATVTNGTTTYSVTTILKTSFRYCSYISSITIPSTVITIENNSFNRCTSLTSFDVDDQNQVFCSIDGVIYSKDKTQLMFYPVGREGAFSVPEGVTSIAMDAFHSAFNLSEISIPETVKTIEGTAFFFCSNLKTVDIPASVEHMDDAVFGVCSMLTEINVSENNLNYKSIDGVLYNFDIDTLLQYPPSKKGEILIPESVVSIGEFSFADCDQIRTAWIKNSYTITPVGNAFTYCRNLMDYECEENSTRFKVMDGVLCNSSTTEIIAYPAGRSDIYIIPSTFKSLRSNTFRGGRISGLVIPESITTMQGQCFMDCSELRKIIDLSKTPQNISSNTFCRVCPEVCVIVPQGCKETYENEWHKFENTNFEIREADGIVVALNSYEARIEPGESIVLKAEVVEFDDSEIKSQVWTSSNPAVASVDDTGKVTAVGNGQATITFTATNNNNKSDSEDCLITVTPDAAVISIEADETNSINFDRQYLVYDLYGKIISDSIHNVLPGLYIVRQGGKAVKIIVK